MRLGPLTGLAAVILAAVSYALQGDTPGIGSSGVAVRAFYLTHDTRQGVGLYLLLVAGLFLAFFAGYLRHVLAASDRTGWLPQVAFAGGILAALGFWISAGLTLSLVEASDRPLVGGGALQALNALGSDLFLPILAGIGVMLLGAGPAVSRSDAGPLPHWLGWAAFVLGVLMFIPFAGFIGLGLAGLWVIAVCVLLLAPGRRQPATGGPGPAGPDGPGRPRDSATR
ncbi:hypothetical protein [Actinacidiphila glaucinigra]|uniref:hypothetical protein n=1 Tax=Actinacidiphila glaucinigra TaxID=235986 RepID=UPI0029B1603F|nr:hypothetical protein [Streptomyces sp. PA03-3a]